MEESEGQSPTESTQLLPPAQSQSSSAMTPLRAIVAAFTIHLLLSTGTNIALTPQTTILQDIVCRQYYEDVNSTNSPLAVPYDCTVEPVQSEVAYVIGWEAAIENIPNMLLAVPFGILADRFGRKKILLLAIFGMFMNDAWIRLVYWYPKTFPVRTVWFAGLWQSIGSGAATLSSITHALVADTCPEEQRTSAFSQIRSAKLLSQLLFVPLGGALIALNPWLPMFISTGFTILGFIAAVLLVPADEASKRKETTFSPHSDETQSLLAQNNDHSSAGNDNPSPWGRLSAKAKNLANWTVANASLVPLILSFFVFQLGEQAGLTLLLQYAAKRLHWTLSTASFLISIRAGVNLSTLIVIVPAVSIFLAQRMGLSAIEKDKRIAQASGTLLVIGCVAVFLGASPISVIFGLILVSIGDVFAIPVRSLATALVDSSHLGVLYTVIEVMTQSGLFIGQPMLAAAFRWGLQLGGFWIGLPFLLAAAFFLFALIAVSSVPIRKANRRLST